MIENNRRVTVYNLYICVYCRYFCEDIMQMFSKFLNLLPVLYMRYVVALLEFLMFNLHTFYGCFQRKLCKFALFSSSSFMSIRHPPPYFYIVFIGVIKALPYKLQHKTFAYANFSYFIHGNQVMYKNTNFVSFFFLQTKLSV